MEGVLLRSRSRWVGEGEKITQYFCSLEKRNFISKQMTKSITRNGETLKKDKEIVEETKQFYEKLYEKKETADCRIRDMVKKISQH